MSLLSWLIRGRRGNSQPEDTFTAFLGQSPLKSIDAQLSESLRSRGCYWNIGPQMLTAHLNPKGRIVGMLEYSQFFPDIHLYLNRVFVPDPEGKHGAISSAELGTAECDMRFIDDVVRTLGSFGLETTPVPTSKSVRSEWGMKAYYPILEQYQTIYQKTHSK